VTLSWKKKVSGFEIRFLWLLSYIGAHLSMRYIVGQIKGEKLVAFREAIS
jgi:hypothetical protein